MCIRAQIYDFQVLQIPRFNTSIVRRTKQETFVDFEIGHPPVVSLHSRGRGCQATQFVNVIPIEATVNGGRKQFILGACKTQYISLLKILRRDQGGNGTDIVKLLDFIACCTKKPAVIGHQRSHPSTMIFNDRIRVVIEIASRGRPRQNVFGMGSHEDAVKPVLIFHMERKAWSPRQHNPFLDLKMSFLTNAPNGHRLIHSRAEYLCPSLVANQLHGSDCTAVGLPYGPTRAIASPDPVT
mmetsp:Transcript_9229/g.18314  ORF Transcript_9229/g.18314 Transcript_9229/m.18314 type:complete len:240 (-) Transcript_9229:373-1092(-)